MRALILFFIGIIFGTGTGVLLALPSPEHDHASHTDPSHDHTAVSVWEGKEPTLTVHLTPEGDGAYNLFVETTGFTFAPEHVNQASVQGEGHAHLYVDGEKIMRIYGPWVHLDNLPRGALLRVSLNTNDHTEWGYNGMPIAAEMYVQ